ncbi:MAG: hypothetical protein J6K75_08710 [Erysipelotrichaceae bacterium]|nr:hypothetical protein [Erysipelotrichaceae bacterium]
MKAFFEEYGFVALAAIVVIILIIMATPVGAAIEEALKTMVNSFLAQVTTATSNIKPFA